MATTTGVEPVTTFEEAVALAMAESGLAEPGEPEFVLPTDEDEADPFADQVEPNVNEVDQPTVDEFDFGDGEESPTDESTSTIDPTAPLLDYRGEKVSISKIMDIVRELELGNMRLEDYTKKTTEVAEMRRNLEEAGRVTDPGAADLWKALKDDPTGTVAYLAVQVGLLDESAAATRPVKGIKFQADQDIEAQVASRVEEAVKAHPTVQAAMAERVKAGIERSFADIEQRVQKPLSEKAKIKVMQFAVDNNIGDLSVAFDALSARSASTTRSVKAAQPQKRTVSAGTRPEVIEINSFDDAVKAAYAELQAAAKV